jgi:CHAD domain-containing protein
MQIANETERKYDVPDGFTMPELSGLGEPATHDLDATYYDTGDLRLARARRTLRRRTGGTDAGWHLKTPGDGSTRTEHRLPLNGGGNDVPAEMLSEVRAVIRAEQVREVARLRTHRVETPLLDADGRVLALIAQDQVTADTDDGTQTWQEIEAELVDGDAKVLRSVERKLLKAGARPASGPSKLARALGDRLTVDAGPDPEDPVLSYVREQRDAIQAYDPGVRRGDAESVHKMRVATRRLRSTLKTFKRTLPAEYVESLKPELKWLAGQLGEVRDGQVLETKLLDAVEQEGPDFAAVAVRVREHLDAKIENGRAALEEDLNGERYLRLLDAIDELAATPPVRGPNPVKRTAKVLAKADALLDAATAGGEDEPLHEARKAYKQARYAVETVAPAGGKPAKTLIKKLTELQDVLGAHQDSVVAREILHELSREADDGFPYGILYARQEQVGRSTLWDLPGVVEASRQKKLRAWLS